MPFFDDLNNRMNLQSVISSEDRLRQDLIYQIGVRYLDLHREDPEAGLADLISQIKDSEARSEDAKTRLRTLKGLTLCPQCGAEVSLQAPFCMYCGYKMPVPQPVYPQQPQGGKIFCNKCGMQLPAGSKFCGRCGNKIETFTPQTPQPAQYTPAPQPSQPIPEPDPEPEQRIPAASETAGSTEVASDDPNQYYLKILDLSDKVMKEDSLEALKELVSLTEDTKRFVADGANDDPERYRLSGIHFATLAWYYLGKVLEPETAATYAARARKDFLLAKAILGPKYSEQDNKAMDQWLDQMAIYESFCAMDRKDYHGALDKIMSLTMTIDTMALVAVCMTEIRVEEGGDMLQCYQTLSQWDQQMRDHDYVVSDLYAQQLFRKGYSNLSFLVLNSAEVDDRIPGDEATIRDLMTGLELIKARLTDKKEQLYIEFELNQCRDRLA